MIVEIQNAKGMSCPLRLGQAHGEGCIAADCMAWRWASAANDDGRGFCGLAGNPLQLIVPTTVDMVTALRNAGGI